MTIPARLLATALALGGTDAMRMMIGNCYKGRAVPDERPCLNCKKPKRHNNSFCSAECCRDYKLKGGNP